MCVQLEATDEAGKLCLKDGHVVKRENTVNHCPLSASGLSSVIGPICCLLWKCFLTFNYGPSCHIAFFCHIAVLDLAILNITLASQSLYPPIHVV